MTGISCTDPLAEELKIAVVLGQGGQVIPKNLAGLRVIDLFCRGGGFSEGFHLSGFDVVYGVDFWPPACEAHSLNRLGTTEKRDLFRTVVDGVSDVKRRLERLHGRIGVVIGSPPCTELSFAKKGGCCLENGLLLVHKHLMFVALFRPQHWLTENVPRLEQALKMECEEPPAGWGETAYE